ncbi:hypothetical protein R1sor_023297 [Riccia sorocarpa]|uniref:protein-serine/threonine phosphatase n=1 Tax=Riccia sorocarpa TaxID=122646 RepID=A0ABD3GP28_9MARC
MALLNAAMTLNVQAGYSLTSNFVPRGGCQWSSLGKCVQFGGEAGIEKKRRVSPGRNSVRCAVVLTDRYGAVAVKGTGRPTMEDTVSVVVDSSGKEPSFFGVFDGHGGIAVAELLKDEFWPIYKRQLRASNLVKATESAYLEMDQLTLAQPKGFLGALRERGVGGAKCGATAAAVVLKPSKDGQETIIASNVGDARVILSRARSAVQLTFDHKPDVAEERQRIEKRNPTPKKPLVVNVDGIWRVGGLLALSRAFGDAYLKDWSDGKVEGARGGFGLTAEPHVTVDTITPDDEFIIVATDGLWEKVSNQEVVDYCAEAGKEQSLESVAKGLVKLAQDRGTTDDISVVVVRLS